MGGEKSEGEDVEGGGDHPVGGGAGDHVVAPALTVLDVCRIVASVQMRPMRETDYDAFAGVSALGPHEIGETDEWIVVRDGSTVELLRADDDYMGHPIAIRLEMETS